MENTHCTYQTVINCIKHAKALYVFLIFNMKFCIERNTDAIKSVDAVKAEVMEFMNEL